MQLYIFIFISLLLTSCKTDSKPISSKKTMDTSISNEDYPIEIKRLGLEYYYDKTKWFIYCIQSDERLNMRSEPDMSDSIVTFGMLPIKFEGMDIRSDSVEIRFTFSFNNKPITIDYYNGTTCDGIMYDIEQDTIIYFKVGGDIVTIRCVNPAEGCKSRYLDPLQPEVIKYINENNGRLDPWFRKEAIKRNILSPSK